MAGMQDAALLALVCVTAGVVVTGSFLWAEGSSTRVRPTTYSETDVFRDPTTSSTVLDSSRSIAFTIALVTDQPWVSDGYKTFSATLLAVPGSAVSRIGMGTIAMLLCNTPCSNTNFVYDDIEVLNETYPNHWVTYEPYFLYALDWGTSLYITYSLAFTVFYTDGSYSGGGWDSGAHLAPIVAIADNVRSGGTMVTYGGFALGVTACVIVLRELTMGRVRP